MKACLILAIVAGAPAVTLDEDQVQVADIIVTGNRNVSTDRIMNLIPIRPGKEYSRDQLKDLLLQVDEKLIDSRMFRNVVPQIKDLPDGQVNLYFNVQEYPNLIQDIIYKNANHISKEELDELTRLQIGMPLDPVSNKRAAYAIKDHLQKQGRYFANVVLEEGGDPGDKRVIFNITEGPVVRVGDVRFVGNHAPATGQRLRAQINSGTGGHFIPAMIDCDVLKLGEYYKGNGFLDVHVSRELIFKDDFRSVNVIFHIHEGRKCRIEKVLLQGVQNVPRAEVTRIVRAKPGDYYKDSVAMADVRKITDYYGWRGRKAYVKKELCFPEPDLVRVVYEVEEAPPVKVGQIIIAGNERTRDDVIRKAIQLYPGQLLLYPQLKLAERNLAKLGIFNVDPEQGIRPTLTVLESDSEFKDILVQVQEAPTGSLKFGAGFNSNGQLVVSMTLEERNFDPHRFPTRMADIREGRAFRGGGKTLRLDLFRLSAPGSLDVMRWYLK